MLANVQHMNYMTRLQGAVGQTVDALKELRGLVDEYYTQGYNPPFPEGPPPLQAGGRDPITQEDCQGSPNGSANDHLTPDKVFKVALLLNVLEPLLKSADITTVDAVWQQMRAMIAIHFAGGGGPLSGILYNIRR